MVAIESLATRNLTPMKNLVFICCCERDNPVGINRGLMPLPLNIAEQILPTMAKSDPTLRFFLVPYIPVRFKPKGKIEAFPAQKLAKLGMPVSYRVFSRETRLMVFGRKSGKISVDSAMFTMGFRRKFRYVIECLN